MPQTKLNYCWICRGKFPSDFPNGGDSVAVDCDLCGPYTISLSKYFSTNTLSEAEGARFSYWNKMRQLDGRDPVRIDAYRFNFRASSNESTKLIALVSTSRFGGDWS
jgi:hypothetical protein